MPTRRDPAALRAEIRRLRREVAELRAAEASYRTIVDRTNSIVLRWDPEGRILFLNDFGLKLFGYALDEVVGHSVLGLIVPDTETSGRDLVAMINDLLKHPERYVSNENENMRRDGERVWITWRNTPIVDAEGRLIEIVSTGIDSTDRKRADDRLRASEERFRELAVRDNPDGPLQHAPPLSGARGADRVVRRGRHAVLGALHRPRPLQSAWSTRAAT
jgi:two-component system sensor histidine kinase/response regulator